MALNLMENRGTPLDRQHFTWRELVQTPISKLDDDAFTRVRVILMNGIESEQNRFLHALARMNGPLQLDAARIRRVEQHQQTLVNWLNPPDQDPLETTLGFELAQRMALPFVCRDLVKSGRVRALGVTGAKRTSVLPDVPTVAEAGVPGYEHILWGMLLVPAATPKDAIGRLNAEAVRALNAPDVRERYASLGIDAVSSTPQDYARRIADDIARWTAIARAADIKLN